MSLEKKGSQGSMSSHKKSAKAMGILNLEVLPTYKMLPEEALLVATIGRAVHDVKFICEDFDQGHNEVVSYLKIKIQRGSEYYKDKYKNLSLMEVVDHYYKSKISWIDTDRRDSIPNFLLEFIYIIDYLIIQDDLRFHIDLSVNLDWKESHFRKIKNFTLNEIDNFETCSYFFNTFYGKYR